MQAADPDAGIFNMLQAAGAQGPGPCKGCKHAEYCADAKAACDDYRSWISFGEWPASDAPRAPAPDVLDAIETEADIGISGPFRVDAVRALLTIARAQHAGDPFPLYAPSIAQRGKDNGASYYNRLAREYLAWLKKHGGPPIGRAILKWLFRREGIELPSQIDRRHTDKGGALKKPDVPPQARQARDPTNPFFGVHNRSAAAAERLLEGQTLPVPTDQSSRINTAEAVRRWLMNEHGVRPSAKVLFWLLRDQPGFKGFTEREALVAVHHSSVTK